MEYKFNPIPQEIIDDIKNYLEPIVDTEEGGFLLGERSWNEDKSILTVTVKEFVKVKNNFSKYDLENINMKAQVLPVEEIGYYPDPEEYMKILARTKSMNEQSDLMLVGFVHSHPMWMGFPSRYDLTHVDRTPGYIMAIYSGLEKNIRVWYVLQNKENNKWSTNSLSLAAVELAATL